MEIAIFGGTFDPPTIAHEEIMRSILERRDIDELWVMPSSKRTDKPFMSGNATRLALLECVKDRSFAKDDRLVISSFEMELPFKTETYKTARALEAAYPEHTFWFVFGADSYSDMPNWGNGEELMQKLHMLLVPRYGFELPEETDRMRHVFAPKAVELHISSTAVRQAATLGEAISGLVSGSVENFIQEHRLYKVVLKNIATY
jgi:nicotinate-nucleotide adenylyltransferase